MPIHRRALLRAGAHTAALVAMARHAQAQTTGTAFIISGFPSGGMGDHVARPLAERLRGRYAPQVVVESRVGAGGRIAVEHVKKAAPDGMTILQIPSSPMVLYPSIYRKLSYDPVADFVPVTSTVGYAFSFTAGPGLPADVRSVEDFIRWARANPRQASYGVPAAGSALHFAGMMLARLSGVELTSVAYRGGAPLLQDVLGGQIPVSFNVLGEVLPHVRAGRLRSLAVATPERSTFLPEVPTFVELGFKDIAMQEHLGWHVPARTPVETVRRLNLLVREGLQAPEMIEALARNGLQPLHQSPEEYAQLLRRDTAHWTAIAKTTGFTAED